MSKTHQDQSISSSEHTRRDILRLSGITAGAVGLGGVLSGCTAITGEGNSDAGNGAATLEIGGPSDQEKRTKAIIRAYHKSGNETKFDTLFTEVNQFNNSLRTKLASGNAPDIFRSPAGAGAPISVQQLAPKDFLVDLSDEPWVDRTLESVRPLVEHDGKVYALLATVGPLPVFYNKKLFKKAGAEVPRTWSGFLDTCARLKRSGVVPTALGLQDLTMGQFMPYALAASAVHADDPQFGEKLRSGKATFSDSGWSDTMDKFLELDSRGFFNSNVNGTSLDAAIRMAARGEAATICMPGALFATLKSYASDPSEFSTFVLPGIDRAKDVKLCTLASDTIAINAKSDQVKEAKAFLRFLAKPTNLNHYANLAAKYVGLKSKGFKPSPILRPLSEFVDNDRVAEAGSHQWPNPEVQQTFMSGVQQLFGGKADKRSFLRSLDKTARQ